ncbi:MAG: rhodanese-related sulfurtransferase [Deltaproteobacteria bacterium]|nr:rhodanese-related sulfurtransferase [Deltaproteobacteria bacterium]
MSHPNFAAMTEAPRMLQSAVMATVVVAAFYKFVGLPDFATLQAPIETLCRAQGIKGTVLLAEEGINSTVAGPRAGIDALLGYLRGMPAFAELEAKESFCSTLPFHRLKVRLKKEIVTIGDRSVSPTARVGTYVEPQDWNALIGDPSVFVVDTRNTYETRLGTFAGAADPNIDNFTDFPIWVRQNLDPTRHTKIAMYCTGGIRCEKASSLLLQEGFPQVFHLKGGILKYIEEIPAERSTWQGECFVFDQRVSIDHALAPGSHALCYGCQEPLSSNELKSPQFEQGVCCPRCFGRDTPEVLAGRRERARQVALATARGESHLGDDALPSVKRL